MEAPRSLDQAGMPYMAGHFEDDGNGASAAVDKNAGGIYAGSGGGRIVYDTGNTGSWGAGVYLLSPYGTPELYVDAYGAVQMGAWFNGPAGLKIQFAWSEAGNTTNAVNGGDGESWTGPIETLAGGGWEFIKSDLGLFTEDLYNEICNPTGGVPANCSGTGNGGFDLQAVSSFNIRMPGNQPGAAGSGTLYFDDAQFITIWKTATPTITQSHTFSPTPMADSPTPSVNNLIPSLSISDATSLV
jgi:hypothetical protein